MPRLPNCGPCKINNCNKNVVKFRTFTKLAYEKAKTKGTFIIYNYLKVGDQLCQMHYNNIVEPDRNKYSSLPLNNLSVHDNNTNTEVESNQDFIFGEQLKLLTKVLYDMQRKQNLPLELDPESFCALIENQEPRLQGFFKEFVDALNPKRRSKKTLENGKKTAVGFCYLLAGLGNKFINNLKLEIGLFLKGCGTSREGIETLSSMGLSVCAKTVDSYRQQILTNHPKKIDEYFTIYNNNLYIFNIDDYHAIHSMHRPVTSITTNDKHFATCLLKLVDNCAPIPTIYQNISIQNPKNVDAFNLCWYLETYYSGIFDTSIHIYNDAIQERKEERSMKGVHMISFQNMNLHSLADYLKAMQAFANVLYLQDNQSVIPSYMHNFVPILGPLHVSLNFREKAIMLYHNFFENLFHFVFGSKKTFAKKLDNIIPATLDIYALLFHSGSFEEYIKTIFHLVNFNDYIVENLHSKIRANTNTHDSVESIITQAKKTTVFLLQHFQKVFITQGQSHIVEQRRYPLYKLVALDAIVDVKCLPTGFNTTHPPSPNNCDLCNKPLIANNHMYDGEVLICGHGYHWGCLAYLEYKCRYCEDYYKKGIETNVKSFLNRLEKGSMTLTEEDRNLEGEEKEVQEEEEEIEVINEDTLIETMIEKELANI